LKHIILIAHSLDAVKPDNAGKPDKQRTAQNQSDTHDSDPDAIKSKKEEKEAKQ
jgi:hypothetical protein